MEFTADRDELFKSLSRTQGIVSTKGAMPILANILVDATDKGITIFATNLDMGLRGSFDGNVAVSGKATFQAKKIFDIVRELPSGDITIKTDDDGRVRVTCGKTRVTLATLPAEEFPAFPEFDEEKLIPVDSEMLLDMIKKTSFAISQDETRLSLNGAYFEISPTMAKMVATDGHRLAYMEREGAFKVSDTIKSIIARKAISELQKILSEDDSPVKLTLQDNHIFFKKGDLVTVIRLIEGAYPNYEQVIPKKTELCAKLSTSDFKQSLRRVATMSDEKSHMVKLAFADGKLDLSSEGGELGEARDEMDIEYSGDSVIVGLNAHYLLDVLNVIGEDDVTLKMQDPLSPVMAKTDADKGLLCIVMPMRL